MPDPVNIHAVYEGIAEPWRPHIVGTFNGHDVMIVKLDGEFVWHSHADTDDTFLVLEGTLHIELRDRRVTLGPGDLYVVQRGVEHRPVTEGEVKLLLIEPSGTPNTGDPATATEKVTV